MKKLSLVFGLFIICCISTVAKDYKYTQVKGDKMQTRIYTLDNGLKVYLSVNNEKPRIQTYIAVKTGSRNDPAETTGLAHYLEHLMFKGTQKFGTTDYAKEKPLLDDIEQRYEVYRKTTDAAMRKQLYHEIDSVSQLAAQYNIPNEYDKLMASIGAEGTNAYTSNDVTCYQENIPSNEVENWAKVQSDRFQNMVIRGFHTELEAVYEEYNMGLGSDNRKMWESISALLFPTHPYGTQSTIGTQEHLKNPSIINIKNYFNKYYAPNNVAICMAGDMDMDKVIAIIDKYFGSWKPGNNITAPQYAPVANLTAPRDTTVVGQEAERLMLGWKFDGAASLQIDTLNIVSEMLSNGKAGLMDLNLDQKMKYLGGGAGLNTMSEYSELILIGAPKEGQSLDEVKDLLLGEIENLKNGNFSDDLLPSIVNNTKLSLYKQMESNDSRASMFVDAFINGEQWENVVGYLDRISKFTKQDIVNFARRHFNNNYAAVYKRQGEDTNQKKIDKPAITPIPSNRDYQSDFVGEISKSKAEPIHPRFVDFKKDLQKFETKKSKLPVLYVNNVENGRFTMNFYFPVGDENNRYLDLAAMYIDYLGTKKMTAEQIKQTFYKLACSYNVNVGRDATTISLSGLAENMQQALVLLEEILNNAQVDTTAYNECIALLEKNRADSKHNQRSNYNALCNYGIYGTYNPTLNTPSTDELRNLNPQVLVDLIKDLKNTKHEVLYYGPATTKELIAIIDKSHKTGKKLADAPESKPYIPQTVSANEVIIAPYNAKNIYMRQYTSCGRQFNIEEYPIASLFNEYFGGGMNTIVFQELREARGLAYSAGAYYVIPSRKNIPEYGITNIITQNDKMMDCIHTFKEILDTIPQSEKSFTLAKQSLEKSLATERITKMGIISRYIAMRRLGIDYDISEVVYKALPNITLSDIVKYEQKVMAGKPYRYIILGNKEELDMESLQKIGPIKHLTTEEIFGY